MLLQDHRRESSWKSLEGSLRAVEDALLEAMGEKAEAEPAMRARTAANFIVTDCCLSCEIVSLRIVRGWKLLDERFFL